MCINLEINCTKMSTSGREPSQIASDSLLSISGDTLRVQHLESASAADTLSVKLDSIHHALSQAVEVSQTSGWVQFLLVAAAFVGGIVASGFGFWLRSSRKDNLREEEENKIKESTRNLVRLEIDQNLEMLRDHWDRVRKIQREDDRRGVAFYESVMTGTVLPRWKTEAWETHTDKIYAALRPEEIKESQKVYSGLAKLRYIYDLQVENDKILLSSFASAKNIRRRTRRKFAEYHINERYGRLAQEYLREFQKTVELLLDNGNPIEEKEYT